MTNEENTDEEKPSKRQLMRRRERKFRSQVASMSLEKALEMFLVAQEAKGHSKATHTDYRCVVGLFIRYMNDTHGYTAIQQIKEEDVLAWLAHLRTVTSKRGRPFSSRSIETYCRDVLAFFHWLTDHHYLTINPAVQVKTPKTEKALIRVFTEDELKSLDGACDRSPQGQSMTPDERKTLAARDRAILWLLLSTGIRVSELCSLRFCDIEWDSGLISVKGKGAKERKVPFGRVARQHLNTYLTYWRGVPSDPTNEQVFLSLSGSPLTPRGAQVIFMRLKRVSGITDKRVSAHTCRHWFAVNAIKRGMPSTVLQGLLGHSKLEQINIYVRLAEQDSRELYTRFSPVDALEMHHSTKGRREQAREWRNGD